MREIMLIVHFIGLTMGLGTSFAHAFLGFATAKMATDDATRFRLHSVVLSKMGNGKYWDCFIGRIRSVSHHALLEHIAIAPVIGRQTDPRSHTRNINFPHQSVSKQTILENAESQLKKMESLGKMTLLIGLVIIVLAVNVFQ